ncbi:MAG TPA: penicillin-binding protein 1C [Syntrophus sp. (in: bacteria)]|nr:penicillin-binding protein 1C [Syntrophus sp. (in: bacteria)]
MLKNGITLAAAVILILAIPGLYAIVDFYSPGTPPPTFASIRAGYSWSEAILLDRHGNPLHELRIDPQGRRLEWVPLTQVSPALIKAIIQAEDRRFYRHQGVDWQAMGGALKNRLLSGPPRGASTITMQLTRKLAEREKIRPPNKTLRGKWRQMKTAHRLEKSWGKDEIIEAYLNLISFRGELQGIAAASRGLFDKDPGGLTEAEALILASLIPSTNQSLDRIARRAERLGQSLAARTSPAEIRTLVNERIGRPYRIVPQLALAPHVAGLLLKQPGAQILSTLDRPLQEYVLTALNHRLADSKDRNVRDGAVLVVDNASGEILAYAGNSGVTSSAPHVDGVRALRQAGSTLKPFLYELAIEKKILTAASVVEDTPLQIPTSTGLYVPENYSKDFQGSVTVRTALASSLNVPAVRTLLMLGGDAFVERLRGLGMFSIQKDPDYYGYAVALGSVDISLYDLVNAYRALANAGKWNELTLVSRGQSTYTKQVMDRKGAFIISTILADREARNTTFGMENVLATRFWTAVKTGTSKDMRDNWCIGYSEAYTVGVWIGNFSGEPMWNVSGVTGAAPLWHDIMNYLHRQRGSIAPQPPPGVTATSIHFRDTGETARSEWFINSTEPAMPIAAHTVHEQPRIIYPTGGMIVALDPDIPEANQLISFLAQPRGVVHEWRLNQQRLTAPAQQPLWKPQRGNHQLSILDKDGRIIDTVFFTVR